MITRSFRNKTFIAESFEKFFRDLDEVQDKIRVIASRSVRTSYVNETTFECWFDTTESNKAIVESLQDLTSFDVKLIREYDGENFEWIQDWQIKIPFIDNADWILTAVFAYENCFEEGTFYFDDLKTLYTVVYNLRTKEIVFEDYSNHIDKIYT